MLNPAFVRLRGTAERSRCPASARKVLRALDTQAHTKAKTLRVLHFVFAVHLCTAIVLALARVSPSVLHKKARKVADGERMIYRAFFKPRGARAPYYAGHAHQAPTRGHSNIWAGRKKNKSRLLFFCGGACAPRPRKAVLKSFGFLRLSACGRFSPLSPLSPQGERAHRPDD